VTQQNSFHNYCPPLALAAYFLVIALFGLASLLPDYRAWGIKPWAYYPFLLPAVCFAIGVAMPLVLLRLSRQKYDGSASSSADGLSSAYLSTTLLISVALGLSFYFMRSQTHFLGDGYQILADMAQDRPFLKVTERGEILAHLWLKTIIGADGERAALLCYQWISIGAGLCYLAALLFFARTLFDRLIDRLLFVLGLASAGHVLLFFGYVENYSLFVLVVTLYTLTGLQIAQGKWSRWLVLPFVALAIFFHVLGITLIPSALYLVLSDTRAGRMLSAVPAYGRWLAGLLVAAVAGAVFYHYYSSSLFFQMALVPLFENRFTIEGYTLFSFNHLSDCLNLLMLLLPGIPVLLAALVMLPKGERPAGGAARYLALLIISTAGAVFVLDPKLGMPRDWDLFSFAGVPLAAAFYFLVLKNPHVARGCRIAALLAVVLGFFSLMPRAAGLSVPAVALGNFQSYLGYDKIKNRGGRHLLIKYYREHDDQQTADLELDRWQKDFPEVTLATYGNQLAAEGRTEEAIAVNKSAVVINPIFWVSYSNIGVYYIGLRQYDSAAVYLEIANGVNPFNTRILNNLGYAYTHLGKFNKAEDVLLYSHTLDTANIEPVLNLLQLYKTTNRPEEFHEFLFMAAGRDGAPALVHKEVGDYWLNLAEFRKAAAAYETALRLGFDSTVILELRMNFPQLNQPGE